MSFDLGIGLMFDVFQAEGTFCWLRDILKILESSREMEDAVFRSM